MAGYAQPYRAEVEAHHKTKQRLLVTDDLIQTLREFLDAKGLHRDFVEFTLVRCVGENRAREIIGAPGVNGEKLDAIAPAVTQQKE